MLIKEILQELFSPAFKPAPEDNWKKLENSDEPDSTEYEFTVADKKYIVYFIDFHSSDIRINFGHDVQIVEFALNKYSTFDYGISGTGNSHRIMELVAYCIRQQLQDKSIHGLYFTAKEPSRRKLYSVLANTIAAQSGWQNRPDLAKSIKNLESKNLDIQTDQTSYLIVKPQYARWMSQSLEDSESSHQNLQELFSPAYKPAPADRWQQINNDEYTFFIGNNIYTVKFYNMPGIGNTIQMVEFALTQPGGLPMQWDLSNTGNSAKVLELVAYTLRQKVISSPDLKGLFFTAKEPSRQKLYAVLANTIAKQTAWTVDQKLANWMNPTKEKPFLIVDKKYAEQVLDPAYDGEKPKPTPEPVRQPDTFGAVPFRFDS